MKKHLQTLLQFVITIGLLWWIFHDPEKRAHMWEALQQAKLIWLLGGVLVFGGVVIVSTQRWRVLLQVQDIHLPWLRVFQLFMIGLFYNLFLPGGTGGDLMKIFYLLKEVPKKKSAAFLSVVVDRMFGLLSMVFLAFLIILFRFNLLMKTPETAGLFSVLIIVLGCALGALVCAFVVSKFHLAHRLPERMPMRGTIIELATAIETYSNQPKAALIAFGLSVTNHCILFLSTYCAARAFTDKLSLVDIFTVFPIILTIASLPISVAGIGVREKITEQLLHSLFLIPGSVAVLISITSFAMMALWSIVGGIVFLFYRPPGGAEHAKLSEMRSEVDALEAKIDHP
ncbi:MAG: lysylphosphatidylglycerol synthase transmembrane domain-containing protein [Chthoniobacterales bacterium]